MTMPPDLFDPELLARRRARAERAPADFLRAAVAAEVSERLKEVNRTFRAPALIGPRPDVWTAALAPLPAPHCVPDAAILDLAEGAHDLVIHALAMHWSNDPVGQLVQARRALAPDGLMIATLFGGRTLSELRIALSEAEVAETGGLSPRVAPMGEIRDLGALLQRAGFALPVADSLPFDVRYPDALALMRDLRAMGETNVLRDRLRRPMPRRLLARAARSTPSASAGPTGGWSRASRSSSSPAGRPPTASRGRFARVPPARGLRRRSGFPSAAPAKRPGAD
jgi:SAM-dependent methyltransferase